jgi:radical SAM superfamily enzyme YgiQ (UPF0313 family)
VGRLEELSEVEFSDGIDGLFPSFQRYRLLGIQTARGCPHNCIYCTYPLLEGRRVRKRPPERIADEIEYLAKRHKIRGFFIVDSTFNADEQHMISVLESIISKELDVRFMCYLEPKFSSPSLFQLLAKAGCVGVDFGTDSGTDTMLQSMRKGFSVDDVISASRACREAGINFTHSLIFGGPGENSTTIKATAKVMDEVGPNAVIAMTGIRIYPGTEIERIARKEGALSSRSSLLEPAFYSAGNQPMWLFQKVSREASERKSWFLPGSRDYSIALGPYGPVILRLIFVLKLYNVIFRP